MPFNALFRTFRLLTAQAGSAPVDICLISESRYIGVADCTFFPLKTHFCLYCHNAVAKISQNN